MDVESLHFSLWFLNFVLGSLFATDVLRLIEGFKSPNPGKVQSTKYKVQRELKTENQIGSQ
jgi:hypothetical protein